MISKFTSFGVEAEVCGQVRGIHWDSEGRTFTIGGIETMMEASEIVQKLSSGGVAAFGDAAIERMANTGFPPPAEKVKDRPITDPDTAAARAKMGAGPRVGDGPIKTHPISELKAKNPALWEEARVPAEQEVERIKAVAPPTTEVVYVPPKAQAVATTAPPAQPVTTTISTTPPVASSTPAPTGQPIGVASTSPPAGVTAQAGEDWRPFATFTRIGQIVDGLRNLVGREADFETVWAKAVQIQAAGACAAMDAAIQQHKGLEGLKTRILTRCVADKVPGAVAAA